MVQWDWRHLGNLHLHAGLIPSPAQGVKDPALPQLWLRLQLQLGSDPWARNSIWFGAARKEKKKKSDNYGSAHGRTVSTDRRCVHLSSFHLTYPQTELPFCVLPLQYPHQPGESGIQVSLGRILGFEKGLGKWLHNDAHVLHTHPVK